MSRPPRSLVLLLHPPSSFFLTHAYRRINSIAKMKAALPTLRTKLNSNAEYFKKVYMHTFDLCKAPGARVLALETAIDMWSLYIPPALHARPSALSRVPTGSSPTGKSTDTPAEFGDADLDLWLDFMREKNRAVSKDTWSLFIDFVRTIDAAYTEYDDEGGSDVTSEEANPCSRLAVDH